MHAPTPSPASLSLGLSSFLKSEHLPIHIPSPSHSSHSPLNPFECLTIQEHVSRCSSSTASHDLATPPLSPSADSYAALYPIPPHMTPQTSPVGTPRSLSPAFSDHHHLPETHLLGKLTIRVVEAKGLAVEGPPKIEKPYVLLQYDRTECVASALQPPRIQLTLVSVITRTRFTRTRALFTAPSRENGGRLHHRRKRSKAGKRCSSARLEAPRSEWASRRA